MKNNLYKTALVAALGLAGATAVQAQTVGPNDLVLGFTSQAAGVTDDYLIDLGQIPSTPGTFDISTTFNATTFGSTFGSALSGNELNAGIVGGSTSSAIDSTLDISGNPSTLSPGSSAPAASTKSFVDNAGDIATSLSLGTPAHSAQTSFFSDVAENPTTAGANANSFAGYVSNPLSTMTGNSIVLDLWENSDSGRSGVTGWTYEGYVDLSFSGNDLTATYDEPAATPEPATYGIFGCVGVLMLGMRRKFGSRIA
ncbi:MAG TPA: hypothetical protein VGN23_14550 [Verrucomicrobiae bacterium]|jgi:hypothetical protein